MKKKKSNSFFHFLYFSLWNAEKIGWFFYKPLGKGVRNQWSGVRNFGKTQRKERDYFYLITLESFNYLNSSTLFATLFSTFSNIKMALFSTYPVLIPIATGFLTESVKVIVASVQEKRFAYEWFLHSGGMPSGHSAFVSSAAMTVAILRGIESTEFMLAIVLAALIMYDAQGLRAQVGLHAHLLNSLQKEYHLEKAVGHKLSQVIAGALFGAICAIGLLQI